MESKETKRGKFYKTISFTPRGQVGFGYLSCWAINEVGAQKEPCNFQVIPASIPETPSNCSVWHEQTTVTEIIIACKPEWGGGLSQNFSLEIRHRNEHKTLAVLKGQQAPDFTVTGLATGTEYTFYVIASNDQGKASPYKIDYATPVNIAEERLSAISVKDNQSDGHQYKFIFIILGSILFVVLLVITVIVVIKVKKSNLPVNTSQKTEVLNDR